jgi:hypothetical protein
MAKTTPTSLQFFSALRWLDGRPLLDTIEPYRRELFTQALDTFGEDGAPRYSMVLSGRAKKNWKSTDLDLAALFCLIIRRSPLGNDCYIVASDEDQAADDLQLAKRLIAINPVLSKEVEVLAKEIKLLDGSGTLRILPGKDIAGSHGKTGSFVGFDEIHTQRKWDLFEALAPDPTRRDALMWVTSYASIYNVAGAPLHDLMQIGKAGTDKRMLFSWYSGDYCTDPAFADLPPEARANPSVASWANGPAYLEQQRTRLPSGRFRRLHLNLPGAPQGAALDQAKIVAAVVPGRRNLPPEEGRRFVAFVDMSGGSSDDAVLCIAHLDGRLAVVDLVEKQSGSPPFSPRNAVAKFAGILHDYGIGTVVGDSFAGRTFVADFESHGITYRPARRNKSELYEAFEPRLNAGEVELPDNAALVEQAVCLVWRGQRIDHEPGGHDDLINAVAGAVAVLIKPAHDALPPIGLGGRVFNSSGMVVSDSISAVLARFAPAPPPPTANDEVFAAGLKPQHEAMRLRVEGPARPPAELSPEAQARLAEFKAKLERERTGVGIFVGKCFGGGR